MNICTHKEQLKTNLSISCISCINIASDDVSAVCTHGFKGLISGDKIKAGMSVQLVRQGKSVIV